MKLHRLAILCFALSVASYLGYRALLIPSPLENSKQAEVSTLQKNTADATAEWLAMQEASRNNPEDHAKWQAVGNQIAKLDQQIADGHKDIGELIHHRRMIAAPAGIFAFIAFLSSISLVVFNWIKRAPTPRA